jgi:hypothetical protein
VYTYYGNQPFDIWGFPLWWGFVNPLMPMIAGALIYKLKPYLSGAALVLAVIAIIPMSDGIANAAVAWPVIAALNMDVGYVGTWIASCITLALALFVVWIISLVVVRPPEPVARRTVPAPTAIPTPPVAAGV